MKKRKSSSFGIVCRMIRDARPIWHYLLFVALLSLASIFLTVKTPQLVGSMTDRIYAAAQGEAVDTLGIFLDAAMLAVLYLCAALISFISTSTMNHVVTNHYTCRIRIEMSRKISRIPTKTVDSTPNGDIIARMTNDVGSMGGSIHDLFNIFIDGVLRLCIILVVIFLVNPKLALVASVFVPLSILSASLLASRSEKHFNEAREVGGKIYAKAEENLTGFDTVKAYHLESVQREGYEQLLEAQRARLRDGYYISGAVSPLVTMLNSISYVAICLVGGLLAAAGEISVGSLLSFILYTKYFATPLETIAYGMSMMQSTVASARRVYDFLDGEEMDECESVGAIEVCGEVVFDDVSFSYRADKPLIEHLNLHVRPGQKVAIVGPTGGGKTTIVNLLMRFYDPTGGKIYVDGHDISEMAREDVRKMFGMVLQDTVLFSDTVYQNIAYGKEGASEDEVMAAARRAHIDTFVDSLPDGYMTRINEESTNISGGQKQLLTIARAYLSARPILILDEATSNVDTRTELLIQETMDELMRGKTSFVIAHRLSTIENADVIIVIDGGHIVEQGTHSELLAAHGLYHTIYTSQYTPSA